MNDLAKLFEKHFNEKCLNIYRLPASGSNRDYYRIEGKTNTAIGTYNPNSKENDAFFHFSEVFRANHLNVPEIFAIDKKKHIYIQQDLGATDVFTYINTLRNTKTGEEKIFKLYKKILDDLLQFQTIGGKAIDFSKAYPCPSFDLRSIKWDLNYFKYYFLKLLYIDFDEQALEKDFDTFSTYLDNCNKQFFMYRDFNARNIMLKDNTLYYIDYQGGRQGPLYYDLASLLYNAKANLSNSLRLNLLDYYKKISKPYLPSNIAFERDFYAFVLIRILQTFGAYGYRGLFEKKDYFIQSIPLAVNNLKEILKHIEIIDELPEFNKTLKAIIKTNISSLVSEASPPNLTINLRSFSYKRGIPYDLSGNGGGYVFDCRGLPNPGRIEKYKKLTGNDKEVIDYLQKIPETKTFLEAVYKIISINIDNYLERGFKNLSINFGCTGGQHRSVYCANKTKTFLEEKYPQISIDFKHCELSINSGSKDD